MIGRSASSCTWSLAVIREFSANLRFISNAASSMWCVRRSKSSNSAGGSNDCWWACSSACFNAICNWRRNDHWPGSSERFFYLYLFNLLQSEAQLFLIVDSWVTTFTKSICFFLDRSKTWSNDRSDQGWFYFRSLYFKQPFLQKTSLDFNRLFLWFIFFASNSAKTDKYDVIQMRNKRLQIWWLPSSDCQKISFSLLQCFEFFQHVVHVFLRLSLAYWCVYASTNRYK